MNATAQWIVIIAAMAALAAWLIASRRKREKSAGSAPVNWSPNAVVRFYNSDQPYGCFSNFSRHPVRIGDRTWPTAEHAFQAAKFTDADDRDTVLQARTPFLAAQVGREPDRSLRDDWDAVRDRAMLEVLRAKFAQHPALASVLASTRGAKLVEHTANDAYWGDGGDGSGRNRLGELLEAVREELALHPLPFLEPSWTQHPDIEDGDLFWRMGGGQDLAMATDAYLDSLSPEAKQAYQAYFQVPRNWRPSSRPA
jgi:ribA/ribD-fused uncharacterized protein